MQKIGDLQFEEYLILELGHERIEDLRWVVAPWSKGKEERERERERERGGSEIFSGKNPG